MTTALAEDLLLPKDWLNRLIDLLEQKRQLVLYGPPGTGKTFLAQAVADYVTELGGTSEIVQFHPSYTYEDFFEGYRPVPSPGGGIGSRSSRVRCDDWPTLLRPNPRCPTY